MSPNAACLYIPSRLPSIDTPIKALCDAGGRTEGFVSVAGDLGVAGVPISARTGANFGPGASDGVCGTGAALLGSWMPKPRPAFWACLAAASSSSIFAHFTALSLLTLFVARLRETTKGDLTALTVCFLVSLARCQKISEELRPEGRREGRTILKYPTARWKYDVAAVRSEEVGAGSMLGRRLSAE